MGQTFNVLKIFLKKKINKKDTTELGGELKFMHVNELNFHQALLPQCKPNLSPSQMPEECHDYEDIQWRPYRVADSDLLMYLRAAR